MWVYPAHTDADAAEVQQRMRYELFASPVYGSGYMQSIGDTRLLTTIIRSSDFVEYSFITPGRFLITHMRFGDLFYINVHASTVMRIVIDSYNYEINGVTGQSDAAPFIDAVHSRTMVSLRLIAETLGAEVDFIDATRTVMIMHGATTLSLQVDTALPNDMGQAAIVGNRTYVPITIRIGNAWSKCEMGWRN